MLYVTKNKNELIVIQNSLYQNNNEELSNYNATIKQLHGLHIYSVSTSHLVLFVRSIKKNVYNMGAWLINFDEQKKRIA